MTNHIAIDLETLSLRPSAAVISAGWAIFNKRDGIIKSAAMVCSDWNAPGRHIDPQTVSWWMQQEGEPRLFSFNTAIAERTSMVLRRLAADITSFEAQTVWASPAAFDLALLNGLYREHNIEVPWHYRAERDGRTLRTTVAHLLGDAEKAEVKPEIPHHPESDAVALAKEILQNAAVVGHPL